LDCRAQMRQIGASKQAGLLGQRKPFSEMEALADLRAFSLKRC
jgi:hypothetical protein